MPGIYLGAILFSLAGMIALDLKFGLALRAAPGRTVFAVGLGTAFFLASASQSLLTGEAASHETRVGINRIALPDGKSRIVGDVAREEMDHARAVTPVPARDRAISPSGW